MPYLTAIILDDSHDEANVLINHLNQIPYIKNIHYFSTPREAIVYLSVNRVDIMFLDMEMPDLSGLEFMEAWAPTLPTIVVSSHTNYAIDCYNNQNIIDYIQKPVTFNRLMRALNRTYNSIKLPVTKELIWLKVGRQIQKFSLSEVIYIEADGIYCKVWNTDGSYVLVNDNITEIEQKIQETKLLRLHKSYIFNTVHIKSFDSKNVWIANMQFPVGLAYRNKMETILSLYNNVKS